MQIKAKILKIETGTIDEDPELIVDAYVCLEVDNTKIRAFVPDWRNYFPYSPPSGYSLKYGLGNKLIQNLIGKKIECDFKFSDFSRVKSRSLVKEIKLPNLANKTKINGKIIEIDARNSHYDVLKVDCGFDIFDIESKKGEFKVGDYIEAEGRLDVYIKKILDNKKNQQQKEGKNDH